MTDRHLPSSKNSGIGNRAGLMLMTLVLLLAFALGSNGLNADVLWIDEMYSVSDMGVFNQPYSPAQIIDSIRSSNNHVPFFYFLGAGWAALAGWTQFALRLMSCFFGVLMVAWLYRFAADAVNRRTAMAAAFLMSTSAFVMVHFHDLRMYALLMLLSVMHSCLYWRLAHGFRATRLIWLLFTLTAAILLYTHNFSIILFVGLGVYHLLFISKSRRWLNIILAWGLGAALFLPYAPLWIEDLSQAILERAARVRTPQVLEAVEAFSWLLVNGFYLLWFPFILSFGYALRRKRNSAILRLLSLTLIMIAISLVIWQAASIPANRMRYVLILWFPFTTLFAWGLTAVPRWRFITALFLLLWGIAGHQLRSTAGWMDRVPGFPPLHEYVYHLKDKSISGDYLVGFSDTSGRIHKVRRNWGGSTADYYLKVQLGIDGVFLESHLMRDQLEWDMRGALNDYAYILFAHNPENIPRNAVVAFDIIREEFTPCSVLVNEPDLHIQRYVNPMLDCERDAPIEYENEVRVIDRAARYVSESNLVKILTGWEVTDESLLDEYNVSVQIITPDWQNVRQEDRHLYEMPPWDVIELSTEGLPPGDYRLMMILYHRDTGEKVSGVDPTTDEAANIFSILPFTIEPAG